MRDVKSSGAVLTSQRGCFTNWRRDLILAQMFCLRNGVRTRREEEEWIRRKKFELFCASRLSAMG